MEVESHSYFVLKELYIILSECRIIGSHYITARTVPRIETVSVYELKIVCALEAAVCKSRSYRVVADLNVLEKIAVLKYRHTKFPLILEMDLCEVVAVEECV